MKRLLILALLLACAAFGQSTKSDVVYDPIAGPPGAAGTNGTNGTNGIDGGSRRG